VRVVRFLAAALLAAAAACAQAQDARPARLAVHFASLQEARAALTADDDWTRTAGDIQRGAIARKRPPVDDVQFKEALARAGRDCTAAERERWSKAIAWLEPRMELLRLLPRVTIVCTDGSDSTDAAYTRGNAIFMPQRVQQGTMSDAELAAHELFHVISRAHPQLATRLYALLGYEPAGELEWPPQARMVRISNPDAPHHRHVMRIDRNGTVHAVMPILLATAPVHPGQSYFDVLRVVLMAVEPGPVGSTSKPKFDAEGRPIVFGSETADYLRQLGGNTTYVFHPEETMADNVAFLASGRRVANPVLLERIRAVIADAVRDAKP
jgi:hypothetical protein